MMRIRSLLVLLGTLGLVGMTSAKTYDLNLTAVAANFKTVYPIQPDGASATQTTWSALAGLNSSAAVTVSSGDLIEASLSFDQPITVSSTGTYANLGLSFSGSKTAEAWRTTGIVNLYLGDVFVAALQDDGDSSSASTVIGSSAYMPSGKTFTFDNMVSFTAVSGLTAPTKLNRASFSFFTFTPIASVPEPSTMCLFGLALVAGCIGLRRPAR